MRSPTASCSTSSPATAISKRRAPTSRFFSRRSKGLTPAATERAVLPFPSHEVDPYRGLAPHIGVTSVRARALYAIAQGAARVVIASAAALLPRVTTPDRMLAASLALKPGQEISPLDLAERSVDAGFTREDPADERGRVRDPRRHRRRVSGRRDASGPPRVHRRHDRNAAHLRSVDAAIDRADRPSGDRAAARHPSGRSRRDAVRLLAHAPARRGSSSRSETRSRPAPRKCSSRFSASYQNIVDAEPSKGRSTSAPSPDAFVIDWETAAARLATGTELSILGLDAGPREIRSQPAVELKGRVADWVAEIRRLRDEGESILFVAATPGRAERTIELLKEYDVFAVPVERAEDARYAAVLVAVGGLSRGFRLPDAGPADLRRAGRLRRRTSRTRAAALGDQSVSVRPARSQGRRLRRARRQRHRRSSSA